MKGQCKRDQQAVELKSRAEGLALAGDQICEFIGLEMLLEAMECGHIRRDC